MAARVLLAHPGTQYAPHLARELDARGLLHRYWTGLALRTGGWGGRVLGLAPLPVRQRWKNRSVEVGPGRLRVFPLLEWRARRAARGGSEEAMLFERNRRFQESIPRGEIERADVVIGFDTSSWILARRAKELGKCFVLDQSIGHPMVKERVFQGVRERYPEWSGSVPRKAPEMVAAERAEHELADRIVVPSRFVKQTLMREGVDGGKIHIIPFGTSLFLFEPGGRMRESSGIVFLFVGSITGRKGLPVLLEAWRNRSVPGAELWLAGPGEIPPGERARLPDTVKLLGPRGRTEVAELMRQADVFVFPSFFEGLAQVQIEAMAAGLPLIATEEAGAGDLIEEGTNGFLVPSGDAESLGARMAELAGDADLRARMREAACRKRDQLSWARYGERWGEMLESASGGRRC